MMLFMLTYFCFARNDHVQGQHVFIYHLLVTVSRYLKNKILNNIFLCPPIPVLPEMTLWMGQDVIMFNLQVFSLFTVHNLLQQSL
jgi:hypothetical protein